MAPSGALLLLVPAHRLLYGSLDRAFGHERRYEKQELRAKLTRSGLAIETLRHVGPLAAVGWFVQSRILRREHLSELGMRVYDRALPVLRLAEPVPVPFGLSLWAVAKTTGTASASAANA